MSGPAGGIARTILVDPKRSTTRRVPLGLRMRREGRDDIEYPGGTPNSPSASANAPGATTGAAFRSSPSQWLKSERLVLPLRRPRRARLEPVLRRGL